MPVNTAEKVISVSLARMEQFASEIRTVCEKYNGQIVDVCEDGFVLHLKDTTSGLYIGYNGQCLEDGREFDLELSVPAPEECPGCGSKRWSSSSLISIHDWHCGESRFIPIKCNRCQAILTSLDVNQDD